ncbi:hypothetical protein N0V90_002714 [Kalmusia sp. IMI 367209]|nr:hypothetical protein N0V90_002714 [Kalmusia sp. IMI 367209]
MPIEQSMTDMFLAGILHCLPALCAISMPSSQSYLRGANKDTMEEYVAWGRENEFVPLNEVAQGYWGVRSMDYTANLYLVVASYIGAGMLGIERAETLPSKDPGLIVERLSTQDRVSLGITKHLPKSLEEALRELDGKSTDMQDILGPELVKLYQEVKHHETESSKTWGNEKRLYMLHF